MKHISESIIGRKGSRIDKRAIADGDVLEWRNGEKPIFMSRETWYKHTGLDREEGVLAVPTLYTVPGWVITGFGAWNDDLSQKNPEFDIVSIYKSGEKFKDELYKALEMGNTKWSKRTKALLSYRTHVIDAATPIKVQ